MNVSKVSPGRMIKVSLCSQLRVTPCRLHLHVMMSCKVKDAVSRECCWSG